MKNIILSIALLFPLVCQASIEFHNIEPVTLKEAGSQWVFDFIDYGQNFEANAKGKPVKLFIRYNPKCIVKGEPGNGTKGDFMKALTLLKEKVASNNNFIFGFKANPIKGKAGQFQAENLKVLKQKSSSIVWSVNSSHGHYACEY
jgi:hypothetical protein